MVNNDIKIGDDVYVKHDKSKQRGRESYKVVKLFDEKDENWATLQKNSSKFMSKEYDVKIAEIFPVVKKKVIMTPSSLAKEEESPGHAERSDTTHFHQKKRRKAAVRAR